MERVINKIRYDTSKATCIADDRYWDGHNFERQGRNTYLYRTPNGRYFVVHTTCWQGEIDTLEPVTEDAARELYESLPEQNVKFEEAFPSIEIQDA